MHLERKLEEYVNASAMCPLSKNTVSTQCEQSMWTALGQSTLLLSREGKVFAGEEGGGNTY